MTELLDSACKDIIVRLLDKEERTRLGSRSGASEVKQHKWFAKMNWGLLRHTRPPVCCRDQLNSVEVSLPRTIVRVDHVAPFPVSCVHGGCIADPPV